MVWFKHDIDAHDDIKIKKLLKKCGFSALGIYWFVVELLFANKGRLGYQEAIDEVSLIDGLSEKEVKSFIDQLISLNLVFSDGELIGSNRVDAELQNDEEYRLKKAEAGRKGGIAKASNCQASAKQTLAGAKQTLANSSREEKRREDNITPLVSKDTIPPKGGNVSKKQVIPTLGEVADYCKERGNGIDPQAFIDYYASQKWKKANGQPLYDWKAGVRTWENKRKQESTPKQRTNKMVEDLEERIRLNHSIDPRTGEPR